MRVLLVEPSPELREAFAQALVAEGHAVTSIAHPGVALGVAHETSPQVVVLDASLSPAGAARFVGELRHDGALRDVPIAGIAYLLGSEHGILAAGVQCCLRRLPAPEDIVKAVCWAGEVYENSRSCG